MKKRTVVIALALCICFLFTSCRIPGLDFDSSTGAGEKPNINDTPLNSQPDEWQSSSGVDYGIPSVTVMRGDTAEITSLLSADFNTEGAVWQSACDAIATVSDGVVSAVKCGRTTITATDAEGRVASVRVTVEFLTSQNNGYTFPTTEDERVYRVTSTYEADRLLDRAIASHKSLVIIDFSGVGYGYNAFERYDATLELSSHVSIVKSCYEDSTHELYFEISYETDTASEFVSATEQNTYVSLPNANMIIRSELNNSQRRADDYEDFAINKSNSGTMDVYNTEELWWALQNNLKPNFPLHNSKAELFYERAKMLLREIITDDMTDYEKALAIFDCLVDYVAYDYDAAQMPAEEDFHTDVCYYLEGVFERGRAVCDGKSKALVLLLGIEGIGCVRDFGDARDGGVGHAWNYIELDGEWYLVDTTAADSAYSAQQSIGSFFGEALEITVYDDFLLPMYSLYSEYEYSGIWDNLSAGDDYYHADRYITEDIHGTEYDFYVDGIDELSYLISTLVAADVCDRCVLTVVLQTGVDEDTPFYALDLALPESAEYGVYTLDNGDYTVYYILIDGI